MKERTRQRDLVVALREDLALPLCFSRAGSEGLGYVESLETHLRDYFGVVAFVHHRLLPDGALKTCRRLLPRAWSVSHSGRVSSDLLGPPENPQDVYPVNSVVDTGFARGDRGGC